MIDLKDLTLPELTQFVKELGAPAFRGKQIFKWLHEKGILSLEEMTNVPKDLIAKLKEAATCNALEIENVQISKADGTGKYLFRLWDGNHIESVFMKYSYGNSLCISSQVGCRMGCKFCASTRNGLVRNLTPGEIVDQIISAERDRGEKINHIVVMGIGEPFDNYENLKKAIEIMHDKEGLGIGLRNITLSTCGLVDRMGLLARDLPQVNLAISLHAPNDELRKTIMPVANKYKLKDLMNAVKEHTEITKRRITFEYALIEGVNDTDEIIEELRHLVKGLMCHINLIPLNRVSESGFVGTTRKRAREIAERLEDYGIPCTVRRELGSEIDAACGQLRTKREGL